MRRRPDRSPDRSSRPPGPRRTRAPLAPRHRFRIVVPLILLAFVASVLLVEGYTTRGFAGDQEGPGGRPDTGVPRAIAGGGPVVDTTDDHLRTYRTPDRTVVLTFDDGPDPTWTPRIRAVLDRYGVPGTFFVTGQQTARYPEVLRRVVRSGHEIGVHTFSHPDLTTRSARDVDRELSLTQLALAGAAGIHTSLMRMPYSSTPAALDAPEWSLVRSLGEKGYVLAFIDRDTNDWRRPGAREIADAATPTGGRGAVVLLHDAGGDRAQTVEALTTLIPRLQAEGYRFTTLAELVGAETLSSPVDTVDRWSGRVFVAAVTVSSTAVTAVSALLLVVGSLVLARCVLLLVLARHHARRPRPGTGGQAPPPVTRPVSVVIPAYNERLCIPKTLRSLAASEHPVEIIVVDDGSRDGTADLAESLALGNVTVVRQPNSGKPAALNAGVLRASHDLVVMLDADTVFAPSTVGRLVQPFADPRVGAVAGNAKVGNRRRLLGRWQHIEYVMGFNLDRRMYDLLHCMPTIPGAVGAFRAEALRDAGMVSADTLAEDTDLTMALHRAGWEIRYVPDALGWTEAPSSLRELWRQRYRWSYGTMQAAWKHRHALVERGTAGRFGRRGLPLLAVFQILTPLLAPLIDILALYGLVFGDPVTTVLAWCGVLAVQAVCAAYAFHLDGERLRPLWALPLQQVVYRQVMYLVLTQACLTAINGYRLPWQRLKRSGDVMLPPQPSTRRM
ncbi:MULTISPECIES: bifunctional polysaccharide deacetylase/glycosyltransferase family 2 protein [Streptomyces]|uniref:Bifunctional polysaccharide deacetylase/glycosyltransferase family 2 protein n=1 Tax=Streptomyces koelreuteriae TaxID=2838015 RepID=A0ABX8FUU9_9ACTN|nr:MULTISPECIES: bifunctional polysaccharide deacetylase/glycosyltransferase family 2 protein [Streptomyces]QWB24884.1 bifunctional polysaccharide deacetylase/glycosyltransferase family 2 protein [Streptomyces koelreuteriae]UUA07900.1 bifunctional polysaccharide deacetylase/glycosyltransferase family 2 protein [Streptomyces koelreuteriae]UUA15529.1 bifunctional polysaccharide deacetylase/glycosyltransferase family 2 protein [Streptomyces sp. CRCS-T-1]